MWLNYAAMAQHGVILLLVGTIVPEIMRTFGIGESMTGVLLGIGSLGFLAGPLVAGAVIDRFGARESLMVGLVVELAIFLVFGLSPLFWIAVAANFIMHFGSSFVETTANVMPTFVRSERSAHSVMNFVHMFFSVGAFVGPLLIGLYVDATAEWRPIFYFVIIPTAALFLWSLLVRFPPRPREVRVRTGKNVAEVIKRPYVLLGAAALMFYVGAEVGVSSWVVYYLQQRLGMDPARSAAGLSIVWVFMMVGRYGNSVLGNRVSSVALVTVSSIGGAVGVIGFIFASTPLAAYVLLAWVGLCLAGVFPNVMAELNRRDVKRAGTVTAIMTMGAAFGAGLFQWFVGFLAERVSLRAAFLTPAVLQLLVVVVFLLATSKAAGAPEPSDA